MADYIIGSSSYTSLYPCPNKTEKKSWVMHNSIPDFSHVVFLASRNDGVPIPSLGFKSYAHGMVLLCSYHHSEKDTLGLTHWSWKEAEKHMEPQWPSQA